MSRMCEICGKTAMAGNQIKRDSQGILGRTNHPRLANIQKKTIVNENGTPVKINICTKCLKKMKQTNEN